jgi:DedD protein
MDRRVKERLVGASILVVLIVLIVPELLSGPAPGPEISKQALSPPEPTRNITVDLTTSRAPEPVVEAAAAPAAPPPTAQNATAANATGTTTQNGPPAAAATTPPAAPAPARLETAAPPPTSTATPKPAPAGHAWAVQLGSFASRANADNLVRQLKGQGFSVYVLSGGSGSAARYRVRIGPMADRGSATQAQAKLKSLGHVGSLVPPAG